MNKIKQLLLFIFLFKVSLAFSQSRLSGKFQNPPNSGVGNHYTEVSWQFKYNMAIENGWVVMNAYDIDIRPSATSMYRYNGKILSRGQYGSRSPQLEPCGVIIEVNLSYRGTNYLTRIEFNCDGSTSRIGDGGYSKRESGKVIRVKDIGIADVDAYSFVVSGSRMTNFNTRGDNALDRELHERELKEYNSKPSNQSYSNSQNNSNGSSNRPSSPNGTSSKNASNGSTNTSSSTTSSNTTNQVNTTNTVPSVESQIQQFRNDPRQQAIEQTVQVGITLVNDLFGGKNKMSDEEYYLKKEKREKEIEQGVIAKENKYLNLFKENYLKELLPIASKGNNSAQLKLIFKISELQEICNYEMIKGEIKYCDYIKFSNALPQKITWLNRLVEQRNIDAINFANSIILKDNAEQQIKQLTEAAELGSLDAMIRLADYYNTRTIIKINGVYERLSGGLDWNKAFYWYKRAAVEGSPMAAYYLGMIYKYESTTGFYHKKQSMNLKYYYRKNIDSAAYWFTKSINLKKNKISNYALHRIRLSYDKLYINIENVSLIHPNAYLELSELFEKGKGVTKDKIIADKLTKANAALIEHYKNGNLIEEEEWLQKYYSSWGVPNAIFQVKDEAQRPWLGLTFSIIDQKLIQEKKLTVNEGIYIQEVLKNGAAEGVGIKEGDVILRIDGVLIKSINQLISYINKRKPGEKVRLQINRNGELKEYDVVLKVRPN